MQQETILDSILAHKRIELERQQAKVSLAALEERIARRSPAHDFAAALRAATGTALVAEVKKASPSKGVLRERFDHLDLARTYVDNGATAISVLTDRRFFQGSLKYLEGIRGQITDQHTGPAVPLLRKDFVVDPYQVYEARAYGADALLLIVAALDDAMLRQLLEQTHSLGMHALVEVHTERELSRALAAGAQIVGVNNRNLHTFHTTLETTEQIAASLPAGRDRPILVSESGIYTPADVARARACGADAVLVGEALVTAADTAALVQALVSA